jgi:Fe-S-cluster containining protein
MIMGDRCTGQCCESFVLTGIGATLEAIDVFLRTKALDGAQIADMLIPLRRIVAGTELPDGSIASAEPMGGGWVFTCAHFDPATHNCGIYEARPWMCRDFPYGKPCIHPTCAWDRGREGRHPPPPVHYEQFRMVGDGGVASRIHLRVLTETSPACA